MALDFRRIIRLPLGFPDHSTRNKARKSKWHLVNDDGDDDFTMQLLFNLSRIQRTTLLGKPPRTRKWTILTTRKTKRFVGTMLIQELSIQSARSINVPGTCPWTGRTAVFRGCGVQMVFRGNASVDRISSSDLSLSTFKVEMLREAL